MITDDLPSSADNYFVYQDALNLDAMGSDDTLATNQIIWSYAGSQALGASRYSINGVAPMDIGGGDDPNNPGAKSLGAGADDVVGNGITQDGSNRTLTFRDMSYSPDTAIPDAEGVDVSEAITLFASDGTAFSQKSVLVYTDGGILGDAPGPGTTDRLFPAAGPTPDATPITQSAPVFAGSLAWTSFDFGTFQGFNASTVTAGTAGLCMQVGTTGQFFSGFISPAALVTLQANSVYRFRLRIDNNTATATGPGLFPLWNVSIDNGPEDTQQNKLFFEWFNLDNFTAAGLSPTTNPNSGGVVTGSPRTFDIYYTPAPVTAASWNDPTTGWFTAGNDAQNDIRMLFRVLDVQISGNDANLDSGTICLRTLQVDRFPLSALSVVSTPYDATNLTNGSALTDAAAAASGSTGPLTVATIFGISPTANAHTTVTFANGDVTIAPSPGPYSDGTTQATAWNIEVMTVDMGNNSFTLGTPATMADNWPIPWNTGDLLMGTVGVQAPNTAAQDNPIDFMQLIIDSPTNEIFAGNGVAAIRNNLGMPRTTPSDLTQFFYTQTTSNATMGGGKFFRLRLQLICTDEINSGNVITNTGGITVTKMRVDRVLAPL